MSENEKSTSATESEVASENSATEQIEAVYQKFFAELDIDPVSGRSKNQPTKRFATMPYIGSKYISVKKRILFVGLDIGSDEKDEENIYQNLRQRNTAIERPCVFNWHIGGTYCTALYLLKDEYGWEDLWQECASYPSFITATSVQRHKDGENPLSFVSLTNLHKFVTIGRGAKTGDADRTSLMEAEVSLLHNEVDILKPNVIVLQGKNIDSKIFRIFKEKNIKIYQAYHPSYSYIKGGRSLQNYIAEDNFVEL